MWFIIAIAAVLIFTILWLIYNKKIDESAEPQVIKINTPAYTEVLKIKEQNNFQDNIVFEMAGVHTPRARKYFENEAYDYMPVVIEAEPNNKHDPDAHVIKDIHGTVIGYVPSNFIRRVKIALTAERIYCYACIDWRYDEYRSREWLNVKVNIDYTKPPTLRKPRKPKIESNQ